MSKLNVDQQTIKRLFEDKKSNFLIPDYQRPYAWTTVECQTLWDDIFTFAFPDNDFSRFDSDNDEYFLGPIIPKEYWQIRYIAANKTELYARNWEFICLDQNLGNLAKTIQKIFGRSCWKSVNAT